MHENGHKFARSLLMRETLIEILRKVGETVRRVKARYGHEPLDSDSSAATTQQQTPLESDDLNVFRVTLLNVLVPFLWLLRRRLILSVLVVFMLAGISMMAYGFLSSDNLMAAPPWTLLPALNPFGYQGIGKLIVYIVNIVTIVFIAAFIIWSVFPIFLFTFLILGGIFCLFSGFGIIAYQVYIFLKTGIWEGFGIGWLFNPEWLADRTDWAGLKEILIKLIDYTPLSLLLIFGGIWWLASGGNGWFEVKRQIVDRYNRLRWPANR